MSAAGNSVKRQALVKYRELLDEGLEAFRENGDSTILHEARGYLLALGEVAVLSEDELSAMLMNHSLRHFTALATA